MCVCRIKCSIHTRRHQTPNSSWESLFLKQGYEIWFMLHKLWQWSFCDHFILSSLFWFCWYDWFTHQQSVCLHPLPFPLFLHFFSVIQSEFRSLELTTLPSGAFSDFTELSYLFATAQFNDCVLNHWIQRVLITIQSPNLWVVLLKVLTPWLDSTHNWYFLIFFSHPGLSLIANSLTEIEAGAFKGLINVTTLLLFLFGFLPLFSLLESYLSWVYSSKLVSGTFEGLESLPQLLFHFVCHGYCSQLREPSLGGNSISEIEPGTFKGLNQLSSFFISPFSGGSSFCHFSRELEDISLTKLMKGTFVGLENLDSLQVNYLIIHVQCLFVSERNQSLWNWIWCIQGSQQSSIFVLFHFLSFFLFLFWLLWPKLPKLCWIVVVRVGTLVLFLTLVGMLSVFLHWG